MGKRATSSEKKRRGRGVVLVVEQANEPIDFDAWCDEVIRLAAERAGARLPAVPLQSTDDAASSRDDVTKPDKSSKRT